MKKVPNLLLKTLNNAVYVNNWEVSAHRGETRAERYFCRPGRKYFCRSVSPRRGETCQHWQQVIHLQSCALFSIRIWGTSFSLCSQPIFDFFSGPRIRPTDMFSVTQLLLKCYRIHIMFVLCSSELDFKAIQMPGTHIVVTECTAQPRLSSLAFYKLKFICVNQGTTACTDKNHIY